MASFSDSNHVHGVASSVDAERAFSGGRLQVNYLQHGISSDLQGTGCCRIVVQHTTYA